MSLSGLIRYHKASRIDYRTGILFALAALPASQLTAHFVGGLEGLLSGLYFFAIPLSELFLVICFTLGIGALAIYSLLSNSKNSITSEPKDYPAYFTLVAGSLFGLLSALLGIGGGFIAVPFFIHVYRMQPSRAVATSLLAIFINSTVTSVHYILQGNMYISISLVSALGSLLGAQIGSRFALKLPGDKLKKLFALFQLLVVAVYPLVKFARYLG